MIELRNVNFAYPDNRKVISNLNFRVAGGEFINVTGGNGSGKSTLLQILAGAIPHAVAGGFSGDVLIGGKPATQLQDFTSKAAFMMQDAERQFISSSLYEELRLGLWFQGTTGKAAERWRDSLGLKELEKKAVLELSGGQKQRAILAALLALDREILILDEPFLSLDSEYRKRLAEVLRGLKENGKTIIISSSMQAEVLNPLIDRSVNLGGHASFSWRPDYVGVDKFDAFIQLDRVDFSYGNKKVLRDFSASFGPGLNVILGQNGSGKTTLLKLAAGLLKPEKGKIIAAKDYAFVFQNPALQIFSPTLLEEVSAGLRWRGRFDKKRAQEALLLFGFEDFSTNPFVLSFGQKKRLAFACAYALDPAVVFIDEPFLGLDADAAGLIANVIDKWRRTKTLVVAAHDFEGSSESLVRLGEKHEA